MNLNNAAETWKEAANEAGGEAPSNRSKILKAIKSNTTGTQSTVLNKDFFLACNNGSIVPTYIQREGKKAVSLEEFLRGFSFLIDDKLNA